MRRAMFFMLIALATVVSSCNKTSQTSATTQTVKATDLPLKATQYIDTNYPDASVLYVVTVTNSPASFIVTLNTTEELGFSKAGEFLGDGANFHGGHHGGDSTHHDSIHCDTIHGGHPGGGHGGPPPHGNGIPLDSLSSLIKSYITTNYAAFTIRHAELDSICPEGAVTEVVIAIGGQEPLKLYFDAGNAFLMQDSRIVYSAVPQAVKDYITANYATYNVCNRATKLTLANNSIQYIVHLRLNKVHLTVRLQNDGTLICVK
ncbi:MAG: PepSY-like domain-containing protein [Bacteroidota bacterium]